MNAHSDIPEAQITFSHMNLSPGMRDEMKRAGFPAKMCLTATIGQIPGEFKLTVFYGVNSKENLHKVWIIKQLSYSRLRVLPTGHEIRSAKAACGYPIPMNGEPEHVIVSSNIYESVTKKDS